MHQDALDALYEATQKMVGRAECAAQVAVARHGDLLGFRSFGRAPFGGREQPTSDQSLFALFSVTKAMVSSASWILLQEGKLSLRDRVEGFVPGFGTKGKEVITVEQLLTHTAGLPSAQLNPRDWLDPERRLACFAAWELEWEPGSRFTYHGSSGMWLLAEVISQVAGVDYRDFIRSRVFEPLGISDLFIGLPDAEQQRVADVVPVGKPMSKNERAISPVDAPTLSDDMLTAFNRAETRAISSPGGGAVGTAAGVVRFYQGILSDAAGSGAGIWTREILEDALTPRDRDFTDPMTGKLALRGLGVVVAGESDRIWRGFANDCSPRSIGHMGAGGQVAWADPESGISFCYCTNGADRNAARQGATGLRLSTLAANCA